MIDLALKDFIWIMVSVGTLVSGAVGSYWWLRSRAERSESADRSQDDAIDALEKAVRKLKTDLDSGLETVRRDASDSRHHLHIKIDDVRDRVASIEGQLRVRNEE